MKNTTISKALEEVWKIKEEIYEEDKNCSLLESLNRAHRITEKIIKERKWQNKLKLTQDNYCCSKT